MLIHNPNGHYYFLKGIDPYSCGVVAEPGYEIVHVTLTHLIPWREGFVKIADYLKLNGYERNALCAMELRCPEPFAMDDFIAFNQQYCSVLQDWDLYIDDLNPLARTNVAPVINPPPESMLYAFSYIQPAEKSDQPTFIIAGAGELIDGVLTPDRIIRRNETSTEAIREKATYVVQVMGDRLNKLGGDWEIVNRINIYTNHSISHLAEDLVLPNVNQLHGLNWYQSRPPVIDIEYEMDLRGINQEHYLDLYSL